MFSSSGGRQVGVHIPAGQRSEQHENDEPNTVLHAIECSMVACQYVDAQGRRQYDVFLKVGNELYKPPQSEQWAQALTPLMDWIKTGIEERLESAKTNNEDVPVTDAVDVIAENVAAENAQASAPAPVPTPPSPSPTQDPVDVLG